MVRAWEKTSAKPQTGQHEKHVEWSKKGTGASTEKHSIKAICRRENCAMSDGRDAETHQETEKYT